MNWDLALSRNSAALTKIVAALFAMISAARALAPQDTPGFQLPRHIYNAVMRVLRPAESAVRRLIIIAARDLVCKPSQPRGSLAVHGSTGSKIPAFCLFDSLKKFPLVDQYNESSLTYYDSFAHFRSLQNAAPTLSAQVDAHACFQRLRALRYALHDLSRQARRLSRWRVKRDAILKSGRPTRVTVLRPGLSPGWRQNPIHEVDIILQECHRLVRNVLDSS